MNGRALMVLCVVGMVLGFAASSQADHHVVDVVITVENLAPAYGVHFTPVWLGFHDGGFDLFDPGGLASEALERLAEDGDLSVAQAAFAAATGEAGGVDTVVTAPDGFAGAPVFEPGESSTAELTLTAAQHRYMSLASMIIPSNDAFIGNHNPEAIELFDAAGTFKGKQVITILGSMVWDAGTELNTEMDAAFINQTAPNTGETTVCPVLPHPGFLGSYGNAGSDPLILGGTTAAGTPVDPAGGDFTLPHAVVARITIERASSEAGMMASEASKEKVAKAKGRGNGPIIYVTGQGLFYDSIVTAPQLPFSGPFQKLVPGGPSGLQTEFGPGDQGYVGGRWWLDDGDGVMEPPESSDDAYFGCPLLGPGRGAP